MASIALAYSERAGGGYPFAYAAVGMLHPASALWALGLAGLSCWGASQLRLRYGWGLLGGALYCVMNAVHLLVPSQGELVETVGLCTVRRLTLPALVEQVRPQATPAGGSLWVSHGWCTLALTQGQTTIWLFDGIGPWFKLQLPGPFLPVRPAVQPLHNQAKSIIQPH